MGAIDIEDRIADSPTRRTVVKTGVKLAYVTPIVAASFKLREASAQEVMSPGNPNPECRGATCGNFIPCGPGGGCVCFSTSSGGGFCATGSNPCAELVTCPGGQGDCPPDTICIVDSCCGEPVCQPLVFACVGDEAPPIRRGKVDGPTPASR
jgi:hypothetical protein